MKKNQTPKIKVKLSADDFTCEEQNASGLNFEAVISMDLSVTERELSSAVQSQAKNLAIKGFRKGKAPISLVGPELSYKLAPEVINQLAIKAMQILGEGQFQGSFTLPKIKVEREFNPFQTESGISFSFRSFWEKKKTDIKFDFDAIPAGKIEVPFDEEMVKRSLGIYLTYSFDGLAERDEVQSGDLVLGALSNISINGEELPSNVIYPLVIAGHSDLPVVINSAAIPGGRGSVGYVVDEELLSHGLYNSLCGAKIEIYEDEVRGLKEAKKIELSYRGSIADSGESDIRITIKDPTIYKTKRVSLEDKSEGNPILHNSAGELARYVLCKRKLGIWDEGELETVLEELNRSREVSDVVQKRYSSLAELGYTDLPALAQINSCAIKKDGELIAASELNEIKIQDLIEASVWEAKVVQTHYQIYRIRSEIVRKIGEQLKDAEIGHSSAANLINEAILVNFAGGPEHLGFDCLDSSEEWIHEVRSATKLSESLVTYWRESGLSASEAEVRQVMFGYLNSIQIPGMDKMSEERYRILTQLMSNSSFQRAAMLAMIRYGSLIDIASKKYSGLEFRKNLSLAEIREEESAVDPTIDMEFLRDIAYKALVFLESKRANHGHAESGVEYSVPSQNKDHSDGSNDGLSL